DTSSFQLMIDIGDEFLARQSLQVVVHGDALAQSFMQLQRQSATQQWLADQKQAQVVRRVHVKVQQQRELFEGGVAQQVCLVQDKQGMLFLALLQTHDGVRDLAY